MTTKNTFATVFVILFGAATMMVSCGKSDKATGKTDSTVVDSIPASGENAFQSDVVPQTLPSQLDTLTDSVDHK